MDRRVLDHLRIKLQWAGLAILDRAAGSPLVRWTWSSFGGQTYRDVLSEHRPADRETVHEMMSGRYLLAAKLVDTQGLSPFATQTGNPGWQDELQSFSWLRHFRDSRDPGERRFARMLVLDWIGRYRKFDRSIWQVRLTAQRVLNWLRHFTLLTDEASPEQVQTIAQALGAQVQSLRLRWQLAREPEDRILAATALLGAALCDGSSTETAEARLRALERLLKAQLCEDGLHLSRNCALQVLLLNDLVSVRQALAQRQSMDHGELGPLIDRMHKALASLTLGTGEPAYFNGCGQQQVDLVYALQAQGAAQPTRVGTLGGYGIVSDGNARVIADSGVVPPIAFSGSAHAGALSFEFSHGNELVVGNCGPAPAELAQNALLFRQGSAHSAPAINFLSAARVIRRGMLKGRLAGDGRPDVSVETEDLAIHLKTDAFRKRTGYSLERSITLIAAGDTLVGQDRFIQHKAPRGRQRPGVAALRFHLGPGAKVVREEKDDIFQIELASGARWSFLWEGGTASLDDSVRQSAYFGFYRTKQIVVERELADGMEMAWILTRQS